MSNPNPLAICGEAEAADASLKDARKKGYRFEGCFALKEQSEAPEDGTLSWSVSELMNLHEGYLGTKVCGLFLKYHVFSASSEDESMGSVNFLDETLSSACFGDNLLVQMRANYAENSLFF